MPIDGLLNDDFSSLILHNLMTHIVQIPFEFFQNCKASVVFVLKNRIFLFKYIDISSNLPFLSLNRRINPLLD